MGFMWRPSHIDQAWIQIFAEAEWDELGLHLNVECVKHDTLCVLAATDSKPSGRNKICLEWREMNRSRAMRSGCIWSRGLPGVESFVNDEWRLFKIVGTDLGGVITWVGLALCVEEPHAHSFVCMCQLDIESQ
jgi:hypothetical protein